MPSTTKNHILFDGNSLLHKKTGVGYFAERLLSSLAQEDTNIVVYYFNFLGRYDTRHLPAHKNIIYREVRYIPQKLINLLNRRGIEIPLEFITSTKGFSFVIFPNFVSVPTLRNLPSIAAIYDMSLYDLPQYLQKKNLHFLQKLLPRTVSRSDFIITISEFTKSRILHYFPHYDSNNILVLPIPYEKDNTSDSNETVSDKIDQIVSKNKYILHVGTIEPRKNIQALVDGYLASEDAVKNKYKLVLMGNIGWMSEELVKTIQEKHSDSILITGYVNNTERDLLYKNASLVCMLSLYEGFGMPILEAGSYNLPLVLSDIPVFREVAKGFALYCDPSNKKSVAESIKLALNTKSWSTSSIGVGMSWKNNCIKLLNLVGGE